MKYIYVIFNIICICGCNSAIDNKAILKDSNVTEAENIVCDQNYDSLLVIYVNEFTPTAIDLSNSLSSGIKSFLFSVDTNCLRKQAEYKYFIAMIFGKLALHHLKCCNQFYDLNQMKDSSAVLLINEFKRIAGYKDQQLEILNSGLITNYMQTDKDLFENPMIVNLINDIKLESKRIETGI